MSDNGDVVSIYSASKQPADDRYSINHKLIKPPAEPDAPSVTVTVDGFGAIVTTTATKQPADGQQEELEEATEEGEEDVEQKTETQTVYRYTFRNRNAMTVQVITYGATVTAMLVPDKFGHPQDVIMGFDSLQGYLDATNPQLGGTIGRCANRITDGRFCVDGSTFQLAQNDAGRHHLNGGWQGFDKFLWTPHLAKTVLTMTHVSEFGSEGYPGGVMARATFELRNDNTFHVTYAATTSWPTPVNLCNNVLFNLAGHGAGHQELYRHVVTLNADRVVCMDEERLPTGRIQCVGGTINDLRVPHELGPAISRCMYGGYDEYMCLIQGTEQDLTFACRVVHPGSGRVLEVYTDQPGFQFYTGNRLPDPFDDVRGDGMSWKGGRGFLGWCRISYIVVCHLSTDQSRRSVHARLLRDTGHDDRTLGACDALGERCGARPAERRGVGRRRGGWCGAAAGGRMRGGGRGGVRLLGDAAVHVHRTVRADCWEAWRHVFAAWRVLCEHAKVSGRSECGGCAVVFCGWVVFRLKRLNATVFISSRKDEFPRRDSVSGSDVQARNRVQVRIVHGRL